MRQHLRATVVVLTSLGAAACASHHAAEVASKSPKSSRVAAVDTRPVPISIHGVENAFRLSERVYSGSQPEGPETFAALAALGVRTIVTVDGARPDVEAAKAHGLRYIHLPVGYDGIPRSTEVALWHVMHEVDGPVFFHCHHGKHRGPTAAAIALMTEGASRDQGRAILETCGTSPHYQGLYASVDRMVPPSESELESPVALPEVAKTTLLVDAMVDIDANWERLKEIERHGWKAPPDQPDLSPAHEALQLRERFTELVRSGETHEPHAEYARLLRESEVHAEALESALRSGNLAAATLAAKAVGTACKVCHDVSRNPPLAK